MNGTRLAHCYGGTLEGQTLHVAEDLHRMPVMDPVTKEVQTYDVLECRFEAGWSVRVLVLLGYPYGDTLKARILADYSCPECKAGKHGNCDSTTLNEDTDEIVTCPCSTTHEKEKPA